MASAYGTLATNGMHYRPMAITKVVDSNDETSSRLSPSGSRAVLTRDRLCGDIDPQGRDRRWNGAPGQHRTSGRGQDRDIQDYRDAWFVGYTPQLVTAVWVGYYETETPMRSVNGGRGFGGTLAAPIWAKFMKHALAGRAQARLPQAGRSPSTPGRSAGEPADGAEDHGPGVVGMTGRKPGLGGVEASRSCQRMSTPGGPSRRRREAVPRRRRRRLKSGGTITRLVSKGPQRATSLRSPAPTPPPPGSRTARRPSHGSSEARHPEAGFVAALAAPSLAPLDAYHP